MEPTPTTWFERKELVVFDVDGTLALGTNALPGAIELVQSLRALDIHVAFISNDSGYTKHTKAARLEAAGIQVLDQEREVVTPLDAMVHYLAESEYQRFYLAASPEVTTWLGRFGIEHREADPELVVLCRDTTLDYAKLTRITQLVHGGVPYVASNPDRFYPTPEGPGVDLAGLIELIAVTTGGIRPLHIFGKPHATTLESVARPLGLAPAQVLMVGDRLHTDIRMAQDFGCESVVVLTGETRREDLGAAHDIRPTYVVEGVHALASELRERVERPTGGV